MSGSQFRGPLGLFGEDEVCNHPTDAPPSVSFSQPGPVSERGLTQKQQELALDIAQITLDIVGIFEPTPFADGTNALISIGRADWLGAALSGISIIPYIGDLAKAGKLPRYSQKLYDAIQLARKDPEFAKLLRPALEKLKTVLDSIPTDLSSDLAEMVNKIKRPLDEYLGMAKVARRLSLTERLVLARLGSLENVGELVWKNIEIAKDYFVRHGIPEEKMVDALNGIDVHKAVEVLELKKGDMLSTSIVIPPGKKVEELSSKELSDAVGQWFVKSGGGVGKESVGLAHGARKTVDLEVVEPMSTLRSKAAHVDDSWTNSMQMKAGHPSMPGGAGTKRKPWTELEYDAQAKQIKVSPAKDKKTGKVLRDKDGNLKSSLGIGTRGGGSQYYIPKSAQKSGRGLKVATRVVKYGEKASEE